MSGTAGGTQPAAPEPALPDVAQLEALSSKKAYERFLPLAKAVEAKALVECRADIALVYHTVQRSVDQVLDRESVLRQLPQVKLEELRTLPQLAQGLAYAVLQLHGHPEAASFGPLFDQAQRLRRKLLKLADALAEAGLLGEEDAKALVLLGRTDVAGDCLALAAMLRRSEATAAGRSPVAAAELTEAEQVATRLQELLTARGSTEDGQPLPWLAEATQIRDRFWTLLNQRYEVLWRCGAWLYGREVDERVLPLQMRHAARPQVQPQARLALVPYRNPNPPPPPERPSAMRRLQDKLRSLVSVKVGRSSR